MKSDSKLTLSCPSLQSSLLAKVHESKGDFRTALTHEKERYGIYRKQVNDYIPKMVSRFVLP